MSAKEAKTEDLGSMGEVAPKAPKGPILLAIVNSVVVLGVLGFLVYSKLMFKRPVITEHGERTRLAQIHASPTPPPVPGMIFFDPITVNIRSTPGVPKPGEGSQQLQGKLHYVSMAFAIEIRDAGKKEVIDSLRSVIMDRLLSILGRKDFNELTTVQGRYVLRTQLLDVINQLIGKTVDGKGTLATNVFFTQFVVQ